LRIKIFIFPLAVFFLAFLLSVQPILSASDSKCEIDDKSKKDIADILAKVTKVETKIDMHGTEYTPSENATIWLQLLRNYQSISNVSCYLTSYLPDRSVFLNNILMNYLSGSDGLYYYDIVTPAQTGVYMQTATCNIPSNAFSDDFLDFSNLESYANVTISDDKIVLGQASNVNGHWHLNENNGTSAYDSSGNSFTGTLTNSPIWTNGKLNNALEFNGVNQYVNFGNIENFERNNSVSYEFWFNSTVGTLRDVLAKYQTPRGMIIMLNAGKIQFNIYTSATTYLAIKTSTAYNDGKWHHAVVIYNGSSFVSGVNIYIDSILQSLTTVSDSLGNGTILNSATFNLGSRGDSAFFLGRLDEILVYNKTLTQAEVNSRYNSSYGTESGFSMTNLTAGYIRSKPIILTATKWQTFNSIYDVQNGNITFQILDSSNNMLCNGLGDISTCAGFTSPIKLYARLSRSSLTDNSPEIDKWWAAWMNTTSEEIKGSSEMHVSLSESLVDTIGDNIIFKILQNARILNDRVVNFHNTEFCIDNETLRHNVTYNYCVGNTCKLMKDIMDERCAYGCDLERNLCILDPLMRNAIPFGIGIGIIVFVAVLLRLLKVI